MRHYQAMSQIAMASKSLVMMGRVYFPTVVPIRPYLKDLIRSENVFSRDKVDVANGEKRLACMRAVVLDHPECRNFHSRALLQSSADFYGKSTKVRNSSICIAGWQLRFSIECNFTVLAIESLRARDKPTKVGVPENVRWTAIECTRIPWVRIRRASVLRPSFAGTT